MVRDYVNQLYVPAALSERAVNADYSGATRLADYKKRVRAAWPSVKIEHVESHGVSDSPEVGQTMSVRAFVALGSLTPDDVEVQLVHGTIAHEDDLKAVATDALHVAETYDAGRFCYEGSIELGHTGPFGYTVRVLPKHALLASPAELGVVALPG